MGRPKAQVRLGGLRLVDRAVAALADGGCDSVLAVTRLDLTVPGARVVVNDDPERGIRSSLELAVDSAGDDALAVMLVDTPGIGATAVRAVVQHWRAHARIAVATFDGRRGHPTVMGVGLWRHAVAMAGPDEGARALLTAHPELIDEVPVEGDPHDLDYAADLADWSTAHE
jgi:CTP:molybdopterin cytidylyltransferase MocA